MEEFSGIERKIEAKTKDKRVVNVLNKVLNWELSRSDMDRPIGAREDFRDFIKEECEKNVNQ